MRRTMRWWAVVVVLALVAGGAAWWSLFRSSAGEVLASFVGGARWSEGRSALALPYRPYEAVHLADHGPLLAALYATPALEDPSRPLALANLYLWRAEPGDLERAERHLESAAESAAIWNERALVALQRGRYADAWVAIEKALALEPRQPAALFNRALLLGRMVLAHHATSAWEAFLVVESEGPWADEARLHLDALRQPAAPALDRSAALSALMDELLAVGDAAGAAALANLPSTIELLAALEAEGEEIYRREFAWLQGLDQAGWSAYRAAAARYPIVRAAVLAGKADWKELERLRGVEGPVLAVRFTHLAAYDAIQRGELEETKRLSAELASLCGRHGCVLEPILMASDLGLLLQRRGDYQGAAAAFDKALSSLPPTNLFRRAELLGKLAYHASLTGAPDEAMRLGQEAAETARRSGRSEVLSIALLNLAERISEQGLDELALLYLRETQQLAAAGGIARIEYKARLLEATVLRRLGRREEAEALLESSQEAIERLSLPDVRFLHQLKIAAIRADQQRHADALDLARRVVEATRALPGVHAQYRLDALTVAAAAQVELGDRAGAAATLSSLLAELVELEARAPSRLAAQRMETEHAEARATLASLQAGLGSAEEVWNTLAGNGRRQLEEDECLAAYVVHQGRIAIWLATADGTVGIETAADAMRPEDAGSPIAAGRCPAGTRRLILLDVPATRRGAIARLVRMQHPGVAIVVSRDPALPWPDHRVGGPALVVHSPSHDGATEGLGSLPHAAAEASLVSDSWPDPIVLQGAAAVPNAVASESSRAGVLHFAVHGEARNGKGGASYLQLAGKEGRLQVVDILDLPLRGRPLVTLSACRAGRRSLDVERDGAGLAWAFLRAGAGAVISNQDDLADEIALDFSRELYRSLGEGSGLSLAFESAIAEIGRKHSQLAAGSFVLSI